MMYAPIALFVYNRPEHTRQTIEALQKNKFAAESELFIFSDGPKNEASEVAVGMVRDYLKTVSGFKVIHVTERKENVGLASSIIKGVTEIVNRYGAIIVLEDDIVTAPHFLEFMNASLDTYANDEAIASISGYFYPIKGALPKTFFLRLTSSWGWATWKRAWDVFELDGETLLRKIEGHGLVSEFNIQGSYNYTAMLKRQIEGHNDSWAIRWYASCFIANKLTLYPHCSFVQNIGFDGTGRHSSISSTFLVTLCSDRMIPERITVVENLYALACLKSYFASHTPSLLAKIIRRLRKIY